ncbi:AP2 domain-containing protein [Noviherbaspirillum soli]|uniref:AP2 domain-containing protein n=1 Tax=Noviherbaspirillum soli TaxID=1064518 RepID=UPI003898FD4A
MLANQQSIDAGLVVDHINSDTHDNRPCNLRLATPIQNHCNRNLYSNNRSGYKGVRYHSKHGKFLACVAMNGMSYHVGIFGTAEEAAEAYDRAAIDLHGEFARTNAQLGLLPTAPASPAMDRTPVPTQASRSYPGVPDMPLPFPRCVPA